MNINHAKCAIKHVIKRAKERYNLELDDYQVCDISAQILLKKGKLKKIISFNRMIIKIKYLGKNLLAVFDISLELVVTLLPHKCLRSLSREVNTINYNYI